MVTGASLFHVDVVVPTLRANVETLRRIVSLPVPPSFESLRYYLVVDGSHSANIVSLSDNQRVTVLSTDNGQRSLPAGASCARNTGIAASSAEWVVLLDDDVYPHPDLLYQYAQQLELAFGSCRQQNVAHIFGFAGVTELVGSPTSLWAETVRLCGMTVNFRIAALMRNPPWSPTANLMIRIRHPAEQPELVEEMWKELNRTALTAFISRSPRSLVGTCREYCASRHWSNIYKRSSGSSGSIKASGPICDVDGCGIRNATWAAAAVTRAAQLT